MQVTFRKSVQHETLGRNQGPRFEAGQTYDLPDDQAQRWIRRAVAFETAPAPDPKPVAAAPKAAAAPPPAKTAPAAPPASPPPPSAPAPDKASEKTVSGRPAERIEGAGKDRA